MIDIALIVDHKWRDLPGMVILSTLLEEKYGFKVKLIPYNLWEKTLIFDKPKVLGVSILYGKRGKNITKMCREMGTKIAVLMTEGRPNTIEALKYSTGHESNSKYADLWICWSKTVRDYILSEKILPEEKLPVLGCHRFDIYKEPYNKLIVNRNAFLRKYKLIPSKPVISWATNFTHAKFFKKNQEFLIKDWNDLGLTKYRSYSDPISVAKNDYYCRIESANIMLEYLKYNKKIQLMIKPHPAEDHEFYWDFVNKANQELGERRVAFIGFEYIWDVLNATDVHIHRLCTTGVEAWFLNKPSIEFHIKDYLPWSLSLEGSSSDAAKGNLIARKKEELIDLINFSLNGGKLPLSKVKYREDYIEKWLYKVDGKRCEEYSMALKELIKSVKVKVKRPSYAKNTRSYFKGLINLILGSEPKKKIKFWRKDLIDSVGHVDKIIKSKDILYWKNKLKEKGVFYVGK